MVNAPPVPPIPKAPVPPAASCNTITAINATSPDASVMYELLLSYGLAETRDAVRRGAESAQVSAPSHCISWMEDVEGVVLSVRG